MVAGQNDTRLSNVHSEPNVLVATLQRGADQRQPQLQGAISLAHSKIPHKAELMVQESSNRGIKKPWDTMDFLHCIALNLSFHSKTL